VRKFAVVVVAALVGCGESSLPPPEAPRPVEPAPPAIDTAALDAWFAAEFPADQPGVAALIAKRGETVFAGGWGLADLETDQPITTQTLFNLGSLSKTFVASAILILAERGELSLDDPISKYFAFEHPEVVAKVQVRHLLTHTSGLPDNRPVAERVSFYLNADDADNWKPITRAAALDFEPGTRFQYSNPAYNGLALIVEQVSGRPWRDFVRDEIFLPAGMTTSTITDGAHPSRGVAHAYYKEGEGPWQQADHGEVPTWNAAGNGGVWSSVEELARYERALAGAVFLRAETVADARTAKSFPGWQGEAPPAIGWSWFVKELDGMPQVGHTGSQGAFLTQYFVVPEKEVLVVFLMNVWTEAARDRYDAVTEAMVGWLRERDWLDG
jgi:CubicO group peptidase (beta-lactamase class C family)